MSSANQGGSQRLAGKVALVTGATQSMGQAIVERLAGEGATVVGLGRSTDLGEQIAAAVRERGLAASFHTCDITDPERVRSVVRATEARHGAIDIVVNNAAAVEVIRGGAERPLADESDESFFSHFRVGVWGPFYLARAVLPGMVERGRGGVFVGLSATVAARAVPGTTGYAPSKAALEALDRQIANDYGRNGIRANTIGVGLIRVAQNAAMHDAPNGRLMREQMQMLAEVGAPEDVAAAVAFLASQDARFITGTVLYVDGGNNARGPYTSSQFRDYLVGIRGRDSDE